MRELPLSAPLTCGRGCPGGTPVCGEPKRDVAPLDERASYSGQFPTWYVVLYFGCTRDFMLRSCSFWRRGGKNRQCALEEPYSRTNAARAGVIAASSDSRSPSFSPASQMGPPGGLGPDVAGSPIRPIVRRCSLRLGTAPCRHGSGPGHRIRRRAHRRT